MIGAVVTVKTAIATAVLIVALRDKGRYRDKTEIVCRKALSPEAVQRSGDIFFSIVFFYLL